MTTNKTSSNYYPHIDGLRAIAVIAVIWYHYFDQGLPSGYLGVDVFFVISGFVITGYLYRADKLKGWQYFIEFYTRRMKRLLPALLLCITISSIAIIILTTRPSLDIFETGKWAVLGLSNIFLFAEQTNYFATDGTLNPFFHTWSLGVEEQFYLLYPLLFWWAQKRCLSRERQSYQPMLIGLVIISATSFSVFLFLNYTTPHAAFFLLPARIWELGLGAIMFLIFARSGTVIPPWLFNLALGLLCFVMFLPSNYCPICVSVLAVASTAILVLPPQNDNILLLRIVASSPFIYIGLLSYSLYLWHWPILVIGKLTVGTSTFALIFLLVLTTLFATVSYYAVERPIRRSRRLKSHWATLGFGLAIMLVTAKYLPYIFFHRTSYNNTLPYLLGIRPVQASDKMSCHGVKNTQLELERCLGSREKLGTSRLYVVGDSHAAQFVFMLRKALQHTNYEIKFINNGELPHKLITHEKPIRTLDYIEDHIQENDVFVMAFHRGHLNPYRDKHISLSKTVTINDKTREFVSSLQPYLSAITKKRGKVIFIADGPLMQEVITSPSCLMQKKIFGSNNCQVSITQDLHTRYRQDWAYKTLKGCVFDPLPHIYKGSPTLDVVDTSGKYIMTDWNHISQYMSEQLAEPFLVFFESCIKDT
jgi:peptidoglycan/LPS O-acetylase OafA/YrhL